MHPDLHPFNTHKYPHSCPYVCICATACTLTGLHTHRCSHKLARTQEHQCQCIRSLRLMHLHTVHTNLALHMCIHCQRSSCLAGTCHCHSHTLLPMCCQGRWIWGPRDWPRAVALGSWWPAEGGGFGTVSLCGGASRFPWPSIRPRSTVTWLEPCLSGCR